VSDKRGHEVFVGYFQTYNFQARVQVEVFIVVTEF